MKSKIECPACQKELTLLPFVLSMTPFKLTCNHCRAIIRVHLRWLAQVTLLLLGLLIWAVFGLFIAGESFGVTGILLYGGLVIGAWLILDLSVGIWVYSKARFSVDAKRD